MEFVQKLNYFLFTEYRKSNSETALTSTSSNSSRLSTVEIQGIVEKLRRQCYRYSTKKNYYAIWRSFNQFIVHLDVKPLTWEDRLPLYIAYLIENRRRSATICSYILAIRAILKENDIIMNENQFLIASLTHACKLQNDQLKVRLPIRKSLLQVLMNKTKHSSSPFL